MESDLCGQCRKSCPGFWICCDVCEQWFHGRCVNIKKATAKNLNSWLCFTCSKERKSKEATATGSFVLNVVCICHDESVTTKKIVIGCTYCKSFFHEHCVKMVEDLEAKIQVCPKCRRSTHDVARSAASGKHAETIGIGDKQADNKEILTEPKVFEDKSSQCNIIGTEAKRVFRDQATLTEVKILNDQATLSEPKILRDENKQCKTHEVSKNFAKNKLSLAFRKH